MVHQAVPSHIAFDLGPPEVASGFNPEFFGSPFVAVEEFAVDKNGNLIVSKSNVRVSKDLLIIFPVTKSSCPQSQG